MLKSEWKDLPDWTKPEDYAFLDGATREVWAWEFLRRHPQYRRWWQRFSNWKAMSVNDVALHSCANVYRPKKRIDEDDDAWEFRVAYDTDALPSKLPLDVYIGRKWGLQQLYDPQAPHTQGVVFQKLRGFPQMIFTPDDFFELVAEEETDTNLIEHVADRYAVVAFDNTKPIKAQCDKAAQLLFDWQEKMKAAERVKPEYHAGKSAHWIRHLRVLDARRTSPPTTYAEIYRQLAHSDESPDYLTKQGHKYYEAARSTMQSYRKVLLFGGIPGKKQ